MFESAFPAIVEYLGINLYLLTTLIVTISALLIGISTYLYSGSTILAIISPGMMLFAGAWMGLISFWIPVMYGITSFSSIMFLGVGKTATTDSIATEDGWVEYANHMKSAYAAKFGGHNPGFNDEVDKRIAIMQHLKHGFTHTIARDWLRRMEHFTEMNK